MPAPHQTPASCFASLLIWDLEYQHLQECFNSTLGNCKGPLDLLAVVVDREAFLRGYPCHNESYQLGHTFTYQSSYYLYAINKAHNNAAHASH